MRVETLTDIYLIQAGFGVAQVCHAAAVHLLGLVQIAFGPLQDALGVT